MEPIRPVRVMKVGDTASFGGGSLPGRAKATEEVNLSFRVSGPLTELRVNVGDVVKEGDVLAQIDPQDFRVRLEATKGDLDQAEANLDAMRQGAREEELAQLKAQVQSAQATLARAQADYARAKELVATRAVTQEEYDRKRQLVLKSGADLRTVQEALQIGMVGAREEDIRAKEAEIRTLRAAVQAASDQLDYTTLNAPYSGVVAARYVENFETIQSNQQILRLLDISKIEMVIHLPERAMPNLKYVDKIWCRFDQFKDLPLTAKIKEVGTEASQTTRTYPVTLIMDQPEGDDTTILPGMAGVAVGSTKLPEDFDKRGVEVLVGAVFTPDTEKQDYVWVVDAQAEKVERRPVTVGDITETGIVVKEGLHSGEWVVTAGVHSLVDGQQVKMPPPEQRDGQPAPPRAETPAAPATEPATETPADGEE